MAAQAVAHRLVDVDGADPLGVRVDDGAVGDDGDVGGAAADVDDGRGPLVLDRDARAEDGREPLLDHVDAPDVRLLGRREERPLLDLRDAGEHAHHGAAAEVGEATAGLADEVVEDLLRALEVGDDAVDQRRDELHVARLAPLHVVGLAPDGDDLARNLVDGDDGRLVDDDAATSHRDDDRRGAEVHGHRVRDQVAEPRERHQRAPSLEWFFSRHNLRGAGCRVSGAG